MPVLVATPTLGDLLKYELNASYCRETVILKGGTSYPFGAVLGRIAAAKTTDALVKHTHVFLIDCGIYRTASGLMLRFGKMFKVGPIEGYVVLRPESLMRYGYAAMTTADVGDAGGTGEAGFSRDGGVS